MLRKLDGFDHYTTTADNAANITAYLQAAGYTVTNATNPTFGLAAGQDSGSVCVHVTNVANSATPASLSYTMTSPGNLVVFGFGYRATGWRTRIARINGAVDLEWSNTTGKLMIGAVEGVDVIILNAWWSFDIEIDKTANQVRVWANDTLQLTAALPGGAAGTTHSIVWGMTTAPTNNSTFDVDDFYALDDNGGSRTSRLGPLQLVTRAPTSDIEAEWNTVGATGSHFSIAAQLSPNTVNAPYLQANIEGKRDVFGSTTVLPNDNQVFATALVAYARKGDLDDRSLGMLVGTGPGAESEIDIPLTTTNLYREAIFEKAPGNVDWTRTLVEGSNFGIAAR